MWLHGLFYGILRSSLLLFVYLRVLVSPFLKTEDSPPPFFVVFFFVNKSIFPSLKRGKNSDL